jgi:hypothetical protein
VKGQALSINCWVIVHIDKKDRPKVANILKNNSADVRYDRAILLYEEYRFLSFELLQAAEQIEALERYLGDDLLRFNRDPRGICVQAEVGQSFDDLTYEEIAAEDGNIFVKCLPENLPKMKAAGEQLPSQELALQQIFDWIGKHGALYPDLVDAIQTSILHARWSELALTIAGIPDIAAYAATFSKSKNASTKKPATGIPGDLNGFILMKSKVTYVQTNQGSRTMEREYVFLRDDTFGDDFDNLFERKVQRSSLGDPKNLICVVQYQTHQSLMSALEIFMKSLEDGKFQIEEHRKKYSEVFALVGMRPDARIFLRYSKQDETDKAYVCIIYVRKMT